MHKTVEEEVEQYIADLALSTNKNTVVLVEDREDEAFWKRILREFAPQIKPDFPFFSSQGKDMLRKYADHVSQKFLICADSDNDAFHRTRNSDWMHPRRPFIFQTYAHSRENHLIHPCNLQQELEDLQLPEHDFAHDFEEISDALYSWLTLWLFFSDNDQSWIRSDIEGFGTEVSWGRLKSIINDCFEHTSFNDLQSVADLRNISTSIKLKILAHRETVLAIIEANGFEYLFPELEKFEQSCSIHKQDTLWYIQGHCAFDEIILPYSTQVVRILSRGLVSSAASELERNHWRNRSEKHHSYRDLLSVSYRNCLAPSQRCRFFDLIKLDMERDLG